MLEVFRRLGSIQFDPLAVAGRSHDLVLHARVADYDPAWCDLLYERREIFEAYNKGLSLVPTSEFPWFRGMLEPERGADPRRERRGGRAGARADPRGGAAVGARLRARARGDDRLVRDADEHRARRARGVRRHGRARPRAARRQPPVLRPPRTAAAGRRARARGAAATSSSGTSCCRATARTVCSASAAAETSSAASALRSRTRGGRATRAGHALREELVERGELVPVEVEGVRGKRFVLREEVALLEAPPEPPPSVAFLSPFDALVWDRGLLGSLFGFDYVWELFVPPAKRRWGWYVLPIALPRPPRRPDRAADRPGRSAACRCSTSGGRTASRRAAPRGSSTRCATRSAPTCASRARAASSGHPTSERRSGSSSLARDPYC